MKKKGGVEVDKITGVGAFVEGISSWANTYETSAEVVYEDQAQLGGSSRSKKRSFMIRKKAFLLLDVNAFTGIVDIGVC